MFLYPFIYAYKKFNKWNENFCNGFAEFYGYENFEQMIEETNAIQR